ncbi:group I intron-associated PD-(D/E)XK endonuclease [Gordonia rhizosphera]|uniref:group I intron-associated PD-(D/E)XK endonuclease n=1 Tax=Gordonia rhizosphera TaxID=83341 RepID=UPI0012F7030D|nr:group I intron-associated PD-(D/E)XK endonuclease [Gordonia rhizosphera]
MTWQRTYSDKQLFDAIAAANSWRGVLRELGKTATSAGAIRSVRSRADRLGIDYGHFRGQRRWTDDELRSAIASAETWTAVTAELGLCGESVTATVKGHAVRLGLDVAHLAGERSSVHPAGTRPRIDHLDRAGSLLAAAWFALSGHDVSWPLEPSRYDLLVSTSDGIRRVQVKTTTVRVGHTWKVYLSTAHRERKTYDPDEIDDFFVIAGDLAYYLIPVSAVGGLHAIHLSAYDRFRLVQSP